MSYRFMLLTLLAAFSSTSVMAGEDDASEAFVYFRTPSKNIHCQFQGDNLNCERAEPTLLSVSLTELGVSELIGGTNEPVDLLLREIGSRAFEIPYGETWKSGDFVCNSEKTGLTCANGKHGFTLNKKGLEQN